MQVQIDHVWLTMDVTVGPGGMSREAAKDAVQEILDRLLKISPEMVLVAAETWRRGVSLKDVHGWCGPGVSRTSISWEVYEYPDGEDPGRAAGALFDDSLLTDSEEGDGLAVYVHRSPGIAAQVAKIPTLEWLRKQEQSIL
jgi:hypothetical protein